MHFLNEIFTLDELLSKTLKLSSLIENAKEKFTRKMRTIEISKPLLKAEKNIHLSILQMRYYMIVVHDIKLAF